jgi:hypothetical protein
MLVIFPVLLSLSVLAWALLRPVVLEARFGADPRRVAQSRGSFIATSCLFLGVALLVLGWVARLEWFPNDSQRLEVHGRHTEATVTKVTASDSSPAVPYLPADPTAVDIRFDTPSGPVTANLRVDRPDILQQPESSVDPVGTKIRVVYDPENPQKIRPEAEVEDSPTGTIKDGLQIGIGFVLAALLIFAVAMMTTRKRDRQ